MSRDPSSADVPQRSSATHEQWLAHARREQLRLSAERPVDLAPLISPPTSVSTHIHDPLELGVLLSGEQTRLFEDFEFRVSPGDVWMIPMWEPHGWESPYEDTERVVIHFLPDLLGGAMIGDTPWLAGFAAAPKLRPRVSGERMRKQVVGIARELWTEAHEQRYGWVTAVQANVLRLLTVLYRSWRQPADGAVAPGAQVGGLARVMPAVEAVRLQPGRLISVPEAAHLCNLSRRQFHRVFSQTMGVGFRDFCLRARLGHAQHLLVATELPIDSIADHCGFVDRAHLYRHFVKHYGCSPSTYRARAR
jgi:AraC-like DNA-binding protein